MKKLIMILSALLCLVMLFASCTSEQSTGASEETTAQAETAETTASQTTELETEPEPIPEELKIDYAAIIAQWSEYIDFEGETEEDDAILSSLFNYTPRWANDPKVTENFTTSTQGDLVLFSYHSVSSMTAYNSKLSDYEDYKVYSNEYKVFNIKTGKEISSIQYSYRYYPSRNGADSYGYDAIQSIPSLDHAYFGVTKVEVTAYEFIEAVEDEFGYVETPAKWESKTTYSYYDQTGDLLVDGLETPDFEVVSTNYEYHQTIIRIGGKYFLVKDSEIVAKLGSEMQVKLDFDVDEYNGFQYRWMNESVKVLDTTTNRITVDWNYGDYFNQRDGYLNHYTLSNGNILFQQYCSVIDDDGIQFGYDYYAPIYVIVDVTTGEVSEITPTCEIDGVTYEYVIKSLISNANDQDSGLALKSATNQLAEIYLISDGIAAPKSTLVILNSNLQVVTTLDRFLPDQSGIYGLLENGDLLIFTESNLFYTVDVDGNRTEKVQLFVSPYKLSRLIPGGFIATDGILYNDSLKPLVNLGQEYNGYSVVGDSLKAWSIEENRYHYLSINSEGKLSTAYAPKNGTYLDATSYGDCTIYKSVNTYTWGTNSRAPYAFTVYNAQGQTIKTLYGDSCTIVSGMLKITNGSSTTYYILK